ncbi:MAG TPA: FHA domain-containing protein, partial [Pyrinomonadaceae bacterium]|nr:FHA domain-containing protein [Pyrinomonadaceae bacterium]
IDSGKMSFGRGSEADRRFPDDGLSRLHATVYRDGGRVWVVDENSSNGTFVNGERTAPSGTPLRDGDTIKIGHTTTLKVRVVERPDAAAPQKEPVRVAASASNSGPSATGMVAIGLIALTILIVSVSAVFIGFKVFGSDRTAVAQDDATPDPADLPVKKKTPGDVNANTVDTPRNTNLADNSANADVPLNADSTPIPNLPPGKKYLEMTDTERRQYLGDRAMRIAQIIGNLSSDPIPPAAVDKIKGFADAYASRSRVKPLGGCRFGDNLQATFERASKNAPFIVKAFNEKGTDPRIGLYLAMIESEHCVCLQSPTGPLGMFQFTRATAALHGLKVFAGASPSNPDERCEPEPAARAAASYMKALTGRYGTGPASVPLAIGSYNSGEGGLSQNLQKALDSNQGLPRDFWTLIANGDKLSKQFQAENFKYVPKFFAAAIIGENPQDFGLNLQPISTYSK